MCLAEGMKLMMKQEKNGSLKSAEAVGRERTGFRKEHNIKIKCNKSSLICCANLLVYIKNIILNIKGFVCAIKKINKINIKRIEYCVNGISERLSMLHDSLSFL